MNIPLLRAGYTGTDADAANDAITTAGPNGTVATISNNSWGNGTNGNAYDSLAAAYDGFVRDASAAPTIDPIFFVFSAGNSGTSGLTRPKMAKNVVAVAASENLRATLDATADDIEAIGSFSSRGPAADGRIKPDLTAPGVAITGGRSGTNPLFGNIDAAHRWSSGTSHAAPQVAGAAAILTAAWKSVFASQPSPAMLKALLVQGAVEIAGAGATSPRPNGDEGWGRVNLANSFAWANWLLDQDSLLTAPGDEFAGVFEITDGAAPFRVTLVWTDPPALGDPALVNDLDLVLDVGGAVYRGNRLVNGLTVADGSPDATNNVEVVSFAPGTFASGTKLRLRVVASALNGDGAPGDGDATDQRFALVVSNASATNAAVPRLASVSVGAESCTPLNQQPDPGEYVSASVCVENVGNLATGDLVAELSAAPGVDPVGGPGSYGAIAPGATVCRSIAFAVGSALVCGEQLALELTLTDGGPQVGTLGVELASGELATDSPQTFTNASAISIPSIGAATPYASQVAVAGSGIVADLDLLLDDFGHTWPEDVDVRLVSPGGVAATLLSDVGGSASVSGVDFVLDDEAPAAVGAVPLTSGTYRPKDNEPGDAMPGPAPATNAAAELGSFDGEGVAGTWKLYVADDVSGDAGSIASGWRLRVTIGQYLCSATCPLIFADGFELGDRSRWAP